MFVAPRQCQVFAGIIYATLRWLESLSPGASRRFFGDRRKGWKRNVTPAHEAVRVARRMVKLRVRREWARGIPPPPSNSDAPRYRSRRASGASIGRCSSPMGVASVIRLAVVAAVTVRVGDDLATWGGRSARTGTAESLLSARCECSVAEMQRAKRGVLQRARRSGARVLNANGRNAVRGSTNNSGRI